MKKTICCRFDVAPVIRKLVEFAGLFSYDRYHVEYVHSKAQTRDGICVRQVGIIFSGGIAINLFVVNADNPLKPIDDDSRIQIVAAWKSEKTSLHGWQHYNIKQNRLLINMRKRNDEILFDFGMELSKQFAYEIRPYVEVHGTKHWDLYHQLQL